MREELGFESLLNPGDGGVFDVRFGDELVFSKHAAGRFPEASEIVAKLRSAQSA